MQFWILREEPLEQRRRGHQVAVFCECGAKLVLQCCIIAPALAVKTFRKIHRGEGHEAVDAARYKELRRARGGKGAAAPKRRIFDD